MELETDLGVLILGLGAGAVAAIVLCALLCRACRDGCACCDE